MKKKFIQQKKSHETTEKILSPRKRVWQWQVVTQVVLPVKEKESYQLKKTQVVIPVKRWF